MTPVRTEETGAVALLAPTVELIKAEHDAAQAAKSSAIKHAIRAGELLLKAKEQLPHGQFLPWIEQACGFSDRAARGYMRLARLDPDEQKRLIDSGTSLRRALVENGNALPLPKPADPVALTPREQKRMDARSGFMDAATQVQLAGGLEGTERLLREGLDPTRKAGWAKELRAARTKLSRLIAELERP